MEPYIGITGFKSNDDVRTVTGMADTYPLTIMFGFLTSERRVRDPMVSGKRSPAVVDLAGLVAGVPSSGLSMLHYHTRDPACMVQDVTALVGMTGAEAVQLNMAWPSIDDVETLTTTYRDLRVLLQLPARAMLGLTVDEIARRASSYDGLVTYALVDKSGGTGLPFVLEETVPIVAALERAMPRTIIGVAGGFTAENVAERTAYLNTHTTRPYFIDAESGLMTENALDMGKVGAYLRNAAGVRR